MTRRPFGVLATLLLTLALLGACGVTAQDSPEEVSIPRPTTAELPPTPSPEDPQVTVYLVRGSRLQPVRRPTERPDVDTALSALATGPTRTEVLDGVRTALSPQSLVLDRRGSAGTVATISVSREFTDVAGGNQLLAVAQVVWTVTELPGVDRVRITADDRPVEVPTDSGLTADPVGREDFAALAPVTSTSPPPHPGPPAPTSSGGLPPATPGTSPAPTTTGRRRTTTPGHPSRH